MPPASPPPHSSMMVPGTPSRMVLSDEAIALAEGKSPEDIADAIDFRASAVVFTDGF